MKNTFSNEQLNTIAYSLSRAIGELDDTKLLTDETELMTSLEKTYNKVEKLLGN